jgi:hypothetical protein
MKAKDFITIENRLTNKIMRIWLKDNVDTIAKLSILIKDKHYNDAMLLAGELSQFKYDEKLFKYAIAQSKLLYLVGGRKLGTNKQILKTLKEETLGANVLLLLEGIKENFHNVLIKNLRGAISKEQKNFSKVEKIAQPAGDYLKGMTKHGRVLINYSTSLHSTRVAAFGFVSMAEFTGVTHYRVDEQLDSRICPICTLMDKTTFKVSDVQPWLEGLIGVQDSSTLKSVAPFQPQTKAGLAELATMTKGDLVKKGLHTPPYHPLCRGLLGESKETTVDYSQVPDKEKSKELLRQVVGDEIKDTDDILEVAQAIFNPASINDIPEGALDEILLNAIKNFLSSGASVEQGEDFLATILGPNSDDRIEEILSTLLTGEIT